MTAHGAIEFGHGSFSPGQLVAVFSAIPADVTFVDAEGIVRYYSEYRIFSRTPECLDRDVLSCHSPETRPRIERLLGEFRDGWRDEALFLEHKGGRPVSTRYVAVHDREGVYVGCVEIAQWADEIGVG